MTPCEETPLSHSIRCPKSGRSGSLRRNGLAVAAALRRQRISRQGLTAQLMGDPPFGRSALAAVRKCVPAYPPALQVDMHSVLTRAPDDFEPVEHDDGAALDLAGLSDWICD